MGDEDEHIQNVLDNYRFSFHMFDILNFFDLHLILNLWDHKELVVYCHHINLYLHTQLMKVSKCHYLKELQIEFADYIIQIMLLQ